MFKMATRILGVIALTGWMGAANATLIFDFSWDIGHRNIRGTVHGLIDNDTSSATGIVFSSLGGRSLLRDVDVVNDPGWRVATNSFTVADGRIRSFHLYAEDDSSDPMLVRFVMMGGLSTGRGGHMGALDTHAGYGNSYPKIFKRPDPVTVPEPSSVILMLLGLAGLSFARYRKQY
jgi:hypothetical protein